MTASSPTRRRTDFHPLTVAEVERRCATTRSPSPSTCRADLAADYDFRPGQSLTLRRMVDGRDERRSYSICAPAGAKPRIGVREVPDGLFSSWLVHDVRPGDEIEVATPTGSFTPDLTDPATTC